MQRIVGDRMLWSTREAQFGPLCCSGAAKAKNPRSSIQCAEFRGLQPIVMYGANHASTSTGSVALRGMDFSRSCMSGLGADLEMDHRCRDIPVMAAGSVSSDAIFAVAGD